MNEAKISTILQTQLIINFRWNTATSNSFKQQKSTWKGIIRVQYFIIMPNKESAWKYTLTVNDQQFLAKRVIREKDNFKYRKENVSILQISTNQ